MIDGCPCLDHARRRRRRMSAGYVAMSPIQMRL
jgi:hypothetical protein